MKKLFKILAPTLSCGLVGASAAVPSMITNSAVNVATNSTTNTFLNTNARAFDIRNVSLNRVRTAYAWKPEDSVYASVGHPYAPKRLLYLDTTFKVDFNSTEQKKHWTVTDYDIGSNESQLYKKFWIKQNTESDCNSRAILMQFEVAAKVPAKSVVRIDTDIQIRGKLHINGYWFSGENGHGSAEADISNFTDNQEDLNMIVGNHWENHNEDLLDLRYEDDMIYGPGHKRILVTQNKSKPTGWLAIEKNFSTFNNDVLYLKNYDSEEKIVKKYFNAYVLTSAWASKEEKGGDHHIKDTDLFVKFKNATIKDVE